MIQNDTYLVAYFKRYPKYYIDRYKRYHHGEKFTFNIAPFFLGPFWLVYRKLYRETLLLLFFIIALAVVETFFFIYFNVSDKIYDAYESLTRIAFPLCSGFFANYFYFRRTDKNITKLLAKSENENERLALLKSHSGVWF
jgi:hypothetical protein